MFLSKFCSILSRRSYSNVVSHSGLSPQVLSPSSTPRVTYPANIAQLTVKEQIRFFKQNILSREYKPDRENSHNLLQYLIRSLIVFVKKVENENEMVDLKEVHHEVSELVVSVISENNWWPKERSSVSFLFAFYHKNQYVSMALKLYNALPKKNILNYDTVGLLLTGSARKNDPTEAAKIFNLNQLNFKERDPIILENFYKNCKDRNSVITFTKSLQFDNYNEEIYQIILRGFSRPGCGDQVLSYWDHLKTLQANPSVKSYLIVLKAAELSGLQAIDARKLWVKLKKKPTPETLQETDLFLTNLHSRAQYGWKDWENDV